jgi:hypothetical protein
MKENICKVITVKGHYRKNGRYIEDYVASVGGRGKCYIDKPPEEYHRLKRKKMGHCFGCKQEFVLHEKFIRVNGTRWHRECATKAGKMRGERLNV